MISARKAAYNSLISIEKSNKFLSLEVNSVISKGEIQDIDKSFYTKLVYGVTEKKLTIDYIISFLSSKSKKIDLEVLTLLRLGIYQLMYLEKVPESAAVNETVKLSKKICPYASGFVNAILRGYIRRKKEIELPSINDDPIKYLSVKHSISRELTELFVADYGIEKTDKIFSAFEDDGETCLRVNTLRNTREELIEYLRDNNITVKPTEYSQNGIYVYTNINDIKPFKEGKCFVQDEASQVCTEVLGAKSGDVVIDTCSAPGGKSFGIAMDMENNGKLYSFDLHESKLTLITSGAEKLGISVIEARAGDSRNEITELIGKADKILCDLPCSGFGVIKKKPEIRYKDIKQTESLPEIQSDILKTAVKYLKIGGELVFSTCTLLKRENETVYNSILEYDHSLEPCDFEIGSLKSENGCLTLFPDVHGTDGFFISKLKKIK